MRVLYPSLTMSTPPTVIFTLNKNCSSKNSDGCCIFITSCTKNVNYPKLKKMYCEWFEDFIMLFQLCECYFRVINALSLGDLGSRIKWLTIWIPSYLNLDGDLMMIPNFIVKIVLSNSIWSPFWSLLDWFWTISISFRLTWTDFCWIFIYNIDSKMAKKDQKSWIQSNNFLDSVFFDFFIKLALFFISFELFD